MQARVGRTSCFDPGLPAAINLANSSGSVYGDGRSATIGLKDRYGLRGVQYFFYRAQAPIIGPVGDGLAVEFEKMTRIFLPLVKK